MGSGIRGLGCMNESWAQAESWGVVVGEGSGLGM